MPNAKDRLFGFISSSLYPRESYGVFGGYAEFVAYMSDPATPTATASYNSINISWTPVSLALSYNLYWSTASGFDVASATSFVGAVSPYEHGPLSSGVYSGTLIYYKVVAVNSTATSSPSPQAYTTLTVPGFAPTYDASDTNLSIPFSLVEFYMDGGTEYITTLDRPIYYSGNKYEVFPITIGRVEHNPQNLPESIQLTVSNINREFATILLTEKTQGKRVRILHSYFSFVNTYTTPRVVLDGFIDSLSVTEEYGAAYVQFDVKNDFFMWERACPRHQFSGTCNWIFKSTTPGCQYTGVASLCDRTYNRCLELGNEVNFRGFRHLIALETAELWWGKVGPTK